MKKILTFTLLLSLFVLSACNDQHENEYTTGVVTLPFVMSVDSSDGATQIPFETDGDAEAITWSSSDTTIVLIDDLGYVTVQQEGIVTITAVSGNHTASTTMHVTVGVYEDYIRIRSKAEFLATFTNPANFTNSDNKYVLTADIDFGGDNIEPIGGWDISNEDTEIDPDTPFRATLDGRGYALMNFTISNPHSTYVSGAHFGVSLIPFIDGGTVRNLNIIDATFSGYGFTGSIAGKIASGTIENCFVRATITSTAGNNGIPAGGIAGIIGPDATIRNVVLNVRVEGGFIYSGFNFGTGLNCSAVSDTLGDAGRPRPMRTTAITTNKGNEEEDAALNDFENSIRIENEQLGNMNSYTLSNDVKENIWAITEGYMPFLIRVDGMTPEWAKIN